ncbi:hypothetical protein SCHPADRAFT_805036, partial [Schizopora paradoxa]
REPRGDLVNGYLEVVVEQFKKSYESGTFFSRTYLHPHGVLERSILALFIADLPGARKCGGMHSFSSKRNFCATCNLTLDNINNLDVGNWVHRKVETFRELAQKWKDTKGKTARKDLFKETGVRWTPFLELPYWDPLRAIVIDGMHNLFIGLCAFHCRMFLEIDDALMDDDEEDDAEPSSSDLSKSGLDRLQQHLIDEAEKRSASGLSNLDLAQVRQWISATSRPRWYASLPKNLGDAGHGKLKADQWRSALEFDIPVALAQLWGDPSSPRHKVFRSTMFLAVAIRYATSHTITEKHVSQYNKYMLLYLKSLLEIDPSLRLHPNHHNALHLGDGLLRFGPMHGWWMFPFERVIGNLQRSNTNFKLG